MTSPVLLNKAAAGGNDGGGGNHIRIIAVDCACADSVARTAGRADGRNRIPNLVGKGGRCGRKPRFFDSQKGDVGGSIKSDYGCRALINRAVRKHKLRGCRTLNYMVIRGNQTICGKHNAAALHFIRLDINNGIIVFCLFRCCIFRGMDGNRGGALVPCDLCAAVFG